MNIVLIGFMGTGKTSVGLDLANHLNWEFIDTDKVIEKNLAMGIPQVFENLGEKAFRQEEKKVVAEVSQLNKKVIATGGGVILDQENVHCLQNNSLLVCLECTPGKIMERIQGDNNRPLLAGKLSVEYITDLLADRAPFYKCAHVYINTSNLMIEEIREIILQELNKRGMVYGDYKEG